MQMSLDFSGRTYNPQFDRDRLNAQLGRVYGLMIDGQWRTLAEISASIGDPEASNSSK